jgi:hypothetical protein
MPFLNLKSKQKMKNKLGIFASIVVLIIFSQSLVHAQRPSRVRPEVLQAKMWVSYSLMKPGNTSQGVAVGQSITDVVQILGEPASITEEEFEIDEVTAKVYHYGNNKVYFVASKLHSYEIKDNSLLVGQPNNSQYIFKIGDKAAIPSGATALAFKDFIPLPLVYKKDADAGKKFFKGFMKKTEDVTSFIDDFLLLEFDANNDLVKITLSRQ